MIFTVLTNICRILSKNVKRCRKIFIAIIGKNNYNLFIGEKNICRKTKVRTGDFQMKVITKVEAAKGKVVYLLFSEKTGSTVEYGIAVKSELFGDAEESTINNITSEPDFAGRLLFILADNLVLPSTAAEVVEEYLAAHFTVNN